MKIFSGDNAVKIAYGVVIVVLVVLVFDIRVTWQHTMPDDGEQVCSFKGEGYVVSNGLTGVFLRRREALDAECMRRMK